MRIHTGGMKKGYKYSRKRLWYNNGQIETLIFTDEEIPEGYVRGRLPAGKTWNKGLTKSSDSRVLKISESLKGRQRRIKYTDEYIYDNFIKNH